MSPRPRSAATVVVAVVVAVLVVGLVAGVGLWIRRQVSPPGEATVTREVEAFRDLLGDGSIDAYDVQEARFDEVCEGDRWVGSRTLVFNQPRLSAEEIVVAVVDRYAGPEVRMRLWRDEAADERLLYVADLERDLFVRASISFDGSGAIDVEVTPCGVGDRSMDAPADGYVEADVPR